ncbi:MAG: sporulation protein YqfD [Clostridia bacterium]|nr:sporulation protein YqfD [Clostridia bacterium]
MLKYLFHFLTGYVIIKIEGTNVEDFLNLCTREKIYIHRLSHHGKAYASGELHPSYYHKAKLFARDMDVKISVLRRGGLPFALLKLKKRKAFIAGFLVMMFLMFWLCGRIWVIDIEETNPNRRNVIAAALEENGVKSGMPRHRLKPFEIQQSVMASHKEFSWFWIEVKGTHAVVQVRYGKKPPEVADPQDISNIISTKNGILHRFIVRSGSSSLKEGDYVTEGQLLISGVVPNELVGAMYVHAEGDAIAKTDRVLTESMPLTVSERVKTGNVTKKYSVNILGKDFNLFFKAPKYKHYDGIIKEKRLHLTRDYILPFSVKIYEYSEVKPTPKKLKEQDAERDLKNSLLNSLYDSVGKKNVVSSQFTVEKSPEKIIVTLKAECLENIAKQVPISFEEKPFTPSDISKDILLPEEKGN